jgi:hypothetical protein
MGQGYRFDWCENIILNLLCKHIFHFVATTVSTPQRKWKRKTLPKKDKSKSIKTMYNNVEFDFKFVLYLKKLYFWVNKFAFIDPIRKLFV